MRKIAKIIVHHTASGRDVTTLKNIDCWHKLRWPDFKSSLGFWVGYHYVIGKDWIKQTRSRQEDGAHAYGFNSNSIGIALTGNFENEKPNAYQLAELRKLLIGLMATHGLNESNIFLHKELTATACPGKNLPHSLITELFHPVEPAPPQPNKITSLLNELQEVINKYK